ncbi:unnamed protein product, partial [Sphacelaria rigidula]
TGPPPGSVLSSFASPASWRSTKSWLMYDEDMDGLEEDNPGGGGGRSHASPSQNLRDLRRAKPLTLTHTWPHQRSSFRSQHRSVGSAASALGGPGAFPSVGGNGNAGVGTLANEEYLRKILQSRHPFPPHFHILLYMDRSYLYYSPFTGDREVLPVQGYPTPILPPPFKQLNIRPDGGTGPIPLHTGWTLGGVPKHMSNWAAAAQAAAAQAAGGGGGGSGGMFGP